MYYICSTKQLKGRNASKRAGFFMPTYLIKNIAMLYHEPFGAVSAFWLFRSVILASLFYCHKIKKYETTKMNNQTNQTGCAPEEDAISMHQIFKKKTNVRAVNNAVLDVISELADGSKKIDMSIHQGEGEMVYVLMNKGVIITLHIQEFEAATVTNGREAV